MFNINISMSLTDYELDNHVEDVLKKAVHFIQNSTDESCKLTDKDGIAIGTVTVKDT